MLPDLGALLAGYELYAKQNRFVPDRDEPRLADALEEARALTLGREGDEPASLFYALARRPRIFGKVHGRMTLHLTTEHARSLGFALNTDIALLELMRARVVRQAIGFEELRHWFAEHLVPISRRPWPPR